VLGSGEEGVGLGDVRWREIHTALRIAEWPVRHSRILLLQCKVGWGLRDLVKRLGNRVTRCQIEPSIAAGPPSLGAARA
jgi:hypothetical protein